MPLRLQMTAIEPWIVRQKATTDTSNQVEIQAAPLKPGELVWVKNLGVWNNSGEQIAAKLGIKDLDGTMIVAISLTLADGDAFTLGEEFWLRENDRFVVLVTGSAKKGPVTIFGSGLYMTEVACGAGLAADGSVTR